MCLYYGVNMLTLTPDDQQVIDDANAALAKTNAPIKEIIDAAKSLDSTNVSTILQQARMEIMSIACKRLSDTASVELKKMIDTLRTNTIHMTRVLDAFQAMRFLQLSNLPDNDPQDHVATTLMELLNNTYQLGILHHRKEPVVRTAMAQIVNYCAGFFTSESNKGLLAIMVRELENPTIPEKTVPFQISDSAGILDPTKAKKKRQS